MTLIPDTKIRVRLLAALLAEPGEVIEEQLDFCRRTWDGERGNVSDATVILSLRQYFRLGAKEHRDVLARRWWERAVRPVLDEIERGRRERE